ncbi:EamA family transporter [Pradoshia sp. D12]|jgi:glucose uptake protein|uniref:GRP family sugar transporter n=1 Tax=Bacillaceae TaxID=186817 RepID=UPI00080AF083|nr:MULTISPECIES: GRP family sugar transporter [Bacillaceae]OCA90161.1 glucose transporter GlcU [Bacillus sp. FJAT-27986]QFK70433.1 EamA family transporter [Pradoshia sp. D12]TPF72228.1 glucose transporter GlcU [Bacillus sp. D12]
MSGILLALLAAVCWGSLVLISVKLGGNAYSQTLGITLGAFLFAVIMLFFSEPVFNPTVWIVGLISGGLWAIGQTGQFISVKYIGVSKTVPISTGMQLIGTSLFGLIVFNEWSTKAQIIMGILALCCLIAGVILNSVGNDSDEEGSQLKKGLITLTLSSLGYIGYVVIIRWYEIDGWSAILPQATGMLIVGLVIGFWKHAFDKYTVRNMLSGLVWATGNIALLLSVPKIGVATSYSLSQTGIVISTLGGIFLLGEKKDKKRLIMVIAGCLLVIAGGVILGYTKK